MPAGRRSARGRCGQSRIVRQRTSWDGLEDGLEDGHEDGRTQASKPCDGRTWSIRSVRRHRGQVRREELESRRIRVQAVRALGQAVSLVVVDAQLARNAFGRERGV
jgi:hypothetical protein